MLDCLLVANEFEQCGQNMIVQKELEVNMKVFFLERKTDAVHTENPEFDEFLLLRLNQDVD